MNVKKLLLLLLFGTLVVCSVSAQNFGRNFTTQMVVYKNYGLVYDRAKEAYCYNNKIVGFFIDDQINRSTYLHPAGEINIKVNRDLTGKITGITELTTAEYDKIVEDLDAMQLAFAKRRNEMKNNMDKWMNDRNLRQPPRRMPSPQPPKTLPAPAPQTSPYRNEKK